MKENLFNCTKKGKKDVYFVGEWTRWLERRLERGLKNVDEHSQGVILCLIMQFKFACSLKS